MRIIQSDNPRPLNLLAIGPNGLVAAASDGLNVPNDMEVWDIVSGTRRFGTIRDALRRVTSLAFAANGRLLVGEDSTLITIDSATGEQRGSLRAGSGSFARFAFSPSTGMLVFGESRNAASLSVWKFDGTTILRRWDTRTAERQRYPTVAISENGLHIAAALLDESTDRTRSAIQIHDATTGRILTTIPQDPASPVRQLAFTADGAKLLVRTESNKVQLFDTATGAAAGELKHKGRPFVTAVAVHPRGPVACARTDGTVTFWDVEKREQIRTLDWKAGRLVSVAFSPDGSLAAAGTEDGKIVVWDVDL